MRHREESPTLRLLDPKLLKQLEAYAQERRRSLSVVAEASIASFLSPDASDRMEAVMAKRLDRMSRQIERLNRDTGIGLETLALFVRHWLVAVPAPPEAHYAAAQAKGNATSDSSKLSVGACRRGLRCCARFRSTSRAPRRARLQARATKWAEFGFAKPLLSTRHPATPMLDLLNPPRLAAL